MHGIPGSLAIHLRAKRGSWGVWVTCLEIWPGKSSVDYFVSRSLSLHCIHVFGLVWPFGDYFIRTLVQSRIFLDCDTICIHIDRCTRESVDLWIQDSGFIYPHGYVYSNVVIWNVKSFQHMPPNDIYRLNTIKKKFTRVCKSTHICQNSIDLMFRLLGN